MMVNRQKEIFIKLQEKYGAASTALMYTSPLDLLVATILSAQCTDIRVNLVTKQLFRKYRKAEDYALSTTLAEDIASINFFHTKAKNIRNMAVMLLEKHEGQVPETMEELLLLPGVGRKTANVVLFHCFGKNEGIVVDTHVKRIAVRLCLSAEKTPEKVERDLMKEFDSTDWGKLSNLFILLGRDVCKARTPICSSCVLSSLCPSSNTPSI